MSRLGLGELYELVQCSSCDINAERNREIHKECVDRR